jgi:hypothetical protein
MNDLGLWIWQKTSECVWEEDERKNFRMLNWLSATPWRRMKEWRYSSITLKLDTKWRLLVSFTLLPLYICGKSPQYPFHESLSGPRSESRRRGDWYFQFVVRRCAYWAISENRVPTRTFGREGERNSQKAAENCIRAQEPGQMRWWRENRCPRWESKAGSAVAKPVASTTQDWLLLRWFFLSLRAPQGGKGTDNNRTRTVIIVRNNWRKSRDPSSEVKQIDHAGKDDRYCLNVHLLFRCKSISFTGILCQNYFFLSPRPLDESRLFRVYCDILWASCE